MPLKPDARAYARDSTPGKAPPPYQLQRDRRQPAHYQKMTPLLHQAQALRQRLHSRTGSISTPPSNQPILPQQRRRNPHSSATLPVQDLAFIRGLPIPRLTWALSPPRCHGSIVILAIKIPLNLLLWSKYVSSCFLLPHPAPPRGGESPRCP